MSNNVSNNYDYINSTNLSFDLSELTSHEILNLIEQLPSGKASGLDDIPVYPLKLVWRPL